MYTRKITESASESASRALLANANPNGAAALRRAGRGGAALRATVTQNADTFAQDLAPVIADIQAQGAKTLRAIAKALNDRGMRTRRGGTWHVSNVRNLMRRMTT